MAEQPKVGETHMLAGARRASRPRRADVQVRPYLVEPEVAALITLAERADVACLALPPGVWPQVDRAVEQLKRARP